MLLSFEQIREAAHGALSVREEKGVFIFERMSEQVWNTYAPNEYQLRECHTTAGIRLEFYTNSDYIAFGYEAYKGTNRDFYFFDLLIDDVLCAHIGELNYTLRRGDLRIELPEGRHKVSLYMPVTLRADLTYVELSEGASFETFTKSLKLLCLGDSITQGYDAEHPSLTYTNQLADILGAEMVNHALAGDHFRIKRVTRLKEFLPDIITVGYGTNDMTSDCYETFTTEMTGYIKKLSETYPESKIFVITPLWRKDKKQTVCGMTFEEGCALIAAEAAKYSNMTVIDGMKLTPHLPEFYRDLYLHPNDLGFTVYARNLYAEITKHI